MLNIKAKKSAGIRQKLLKTVRHKKHLSKRPHVYVHAPPFHKLDVKPDRDK
jgi:hypothetical protein